MTESDCEIEYLDEDADIVQQLVQSQPIQPSEPTPPPDPVDEEKEKPLLVERPQKRKRILSTPYQNAPKDQPRKETTVWSKTCVVNEDGDKKSEIFQCVLPNYKEKKTLNITNIAPKKTKSSNTTIDEVVLRKEDHKDGETLVVYKPQSGISSVFTLVDKRKQNPDDDESKSKGQEERSVDKYEEVKMYLKEVTCCRMCVHCFQESWRGLKKIQGPIVCPICGRSFVTVYSLLTHIKAHSSTDVQRFKRVISLTLSEIVGYHYKCRMCREKCTSIKDTREHVATHRGSEHFMCEVGNHWTK
ncbi:hypothetical protein K1T71_012421 [Dendrolimus kikuchii]|uniref:Uncharacterized protein n=1 Tax=Dendrolimus kikuchii TaxID=765133 RepID=A0ACC1CJE3_9NEOP|nr:hypothetical protein K1T71_012421 [Dendrolimus kikuchii]